MFIGTAVPDLEFTGAVPSMKPGRKVLNLYYLEVSGTVDGSLQAFEFPHVEYIFWLRRPNILPVTLSCLRVWIVVSPPEHEKPDLREEASNGRA